MDMAVYMHIQRGRIGYLKTWGHINEQLLYNSCLNFLGLCHISYITMDRLKPIIIICIYIFLLNYIPILYFFYFHVK